MDAEVAFATENKEETFMKKRNKALALLLAGAMVLGTTACGQQAADTKATSDDATATTETAEASHAKTCLRNSLHSLQTAYLIRTHSR